MFTEFHIPYKDTVLVGDMTTEDKSLITMLFIHGAGTSNIERFTVLRKLLASKGVHSYAFDMIGHGKTGGETLGTTLKERVEQVEFVNKTLGISPTIILGSSMGAYVAILISKSYPIKQLVLIVPGIYSNEAYEVPFGGEFSKVIRKEDSWKESDAFDILRKFQGSVSIFCGENDQVVSHDKIGRMIYESTTAAKNRKFTIVPGVGHSVWPYFAEHPKYFEEISEDVINML